MKRIRLNNFGFWIKDEPDYLRFRQIVDDPAQLGDSYATWLDSAKKITDAAQKQRIIIIKVNADPDAFLTWCKANSRRPDQRSRMRFAIIKGTSKRGYG